MHSDLLINLCFSLRIYFRTVKNKKILPLMLRLQCLKIDHEKVDNMRNTRFKIYFFIFFFIAREVCNVLFFKKMIKFHFF